MKQKATRVVTYTRISRDTAGDAHGVANQQAALEEYAIARNWTIVTSHSDNDLSASNGQHRPGFEAVMRMVDARQCDVVLCWAIDRFVRRIADLESVIGRFQAGSCKLAAVSGDMDLSSDAGRTVARMLSVIAQGEVERKSSRQKLAAEQAAKNGKRWTSCPRSFGYKADHVTPEPREAQAVLEACRALLAGSTVTEITRRWIELGMRPSHAPFGPLRADEVIRRQSVRDILLNPRNAGLNAYKGEELGAGDWEAIVPEEVWRAVVAKLTAKTRRPSQGVRTLLGGLALCRCGAVVTGARNQYDAAVYRCHPEYRGGKPGPHVKVRAAPIDELVEAAMVANLSRPEAAAKLFRSPAASVDVRALQDEAAAIRVNLDELAADRALGLVTRSQMLAATERGTARLAAIAGELAKSESGSVLAPFAAAESAVKVWAGLDQPRKRAVIAVLAKVILHPAGQGVKVFNPESVRIDWIGKEAT